MAGSRRLVWSYGLVALIALILLGQLVPLASLFLTTWLPLPLLIVGWRLGTVEAALLALAGALVVFALNPGMPVVQETLGLWMLLCMGLILTFCQHRHWPAGSAIMGTVVFLGLLSALLFLGQAMLQGVSPWILWQKKAGELAAAVRDLATGTGLEVSDLRVLGLPQVEFQELITTILPALVLVNFALVAWVNVVVVRSLASFWRWGNEGEPLSNWVSPEWLVFFLVVAGLAVLAPWPWSRQAGLNLLLVLGFMYFCQGIAVIAALLQRYQVPWFLRGLGYFLAFLNPIMIMVTILGLVDLWLDFRRLQPPQEA